MVTSKSQIEKITDVKRPLKIGEVFCVPCIVKRNEGKITSFTPIIDNPHNDRENGQPEIHYHADYRFIETLESDNAMGFIVIDSRPGFKSSKPRVEQKIDGEIEHHNLPVVSEKHNGLALQFFIRNSKFKNTCITKGKCPHRGFDLSQETPIDGIITCPLHSLKFESTTGNILPEILNDLSKYRAREIKYHSQIRKFWIKIRNIQNKKTISMNEYLAFQSIYPAIYSSSIIECSEYLNVRIKISYSNDFPAKPIDNGEIFEFKVKK